MLNEMMVLAAMGHNGQFDKAGKSYILHCLTVMQYLETEDEELMCIALGHDLIEDTNVTKEELLSLGFSDRVVNGIVALTKVKGQSYDEYKQSVFANEDAMRVKMCDLRHNSDIRRLKGVTEKDLARLKKYHEFYLELKEKLRA
jgi:(p)ppGpp synthase/HD superfamily hydrolase